MYKSLEEIALVSQQKNIPFWQVILEDDCKERMVSPEQSKKELMAMYQAMKEADAAYDAKQKSRSGMVGGNGQLFHDAVVSGKTICGPVIASAIEKALKMGESNACMKRIAPHYSLRRRHARRHPVPPLLRRHGGCLQRHGRYGHRTHGLRRGGRCRPPPGIPLEPFARRFGRAVQIYPQPARHGHLRRRQFGRRHPCRKPHGRMYARCRTPAYGLRRTLIFRPPGMGFPRLGGICGAALRRACAPAPYGTHRAAGRHHAGDVRCLHAPGAPRRRLHVRRLAFQILLFRPFAADRFAHAAQPAGRCRYGLQRLRVAARPAYPFGRRPLFRTPRHALYLCLSAFVLSYDLL